MIALWYANIAAMLAVYVVLDGFDFGAGIVHLFVARTDAERRQVLAAIGPARRAARLNVLNALQYE